MVEVSKPSLRSSARRNVGLESLATGTEVPSSTRSGKRTRDSSWGNESTGSSKKLKFKSDTLAGKQEAVSKQDAKSLPFRDRSSSQTAVTQAGRTRKAVPPIHTLNGRTPSPILPTEASSIASSTQTLNLPKQSEKRSLRSADGGSRSRSELALYIPNYDELVSLEVKQSESIDKDTLLHITDEPTKSFNYASGVASSKNNPTPASRFALEDDFSKTIEWPEETFTILNDASRIEFPNPPKHSTKDPLDDSMYLKAHRREERQEKQLRNIEKERAMHEKVQLVRLLDGLRGHDWLRTMGISGITETEKKLYEPKRDYCISYVRILLDKFRLWKEEEKRRKVERETIEDDKDEEEEEDETEEEEEQTEAGAQDESPDYSDVDASAARQLHQEAKSASNTRNSKSRSHHAPPRALPPEPPFRSFFAKSYMREAAISKHRRGRSKYAFGQPLVEPQVKDFELPQDILTSDALASIARRSRKSKRDIGQGDNT